METAINQELSTGPVVEAGPLSYHWLENWGRTPQIAPSQENGRTHGVAVARDGSMYVFHQSTPAVLRFDAEGNLLESWGEQFAAAHGLTLVEEEGVEYLWLTDQSSGLVAKVTLQGQVVLTLEKPVLDVYETEAYCPTWVAVDGQSGTVFVADGYGSGLIHAYTAAGAYLWSLTGDEGAGRFSCPHGIFVDTRKEKPELLIADRGNHRVQVYSVQGEFLRSWGSDRLTSPCCFAVHGQYLFVPELYARLAVFDGDDALVGYIGANEATVQVPGWPNHPKELIQAGHFNSPHGIGTGPDGSVYVVEWIVGGRIIRLLPR